MGIHFFLVPVIPPNMVRVNVCVCHSTPKKRRVKLTLPDDAMSVIELTRVCPLAVDIRAYSHYSMSLIDVN